MTVHPDLQSWQAARTHPATYPGSTPDSHYIILDDRVLPVAFPDEDDVESAVFLDQAGWLPIDRELARRGLPRLADRTPVIAYGGNRNPGTLALKLDHYGYRLTAGGVALPVLNGRLPEAEAVAGGVSGQGYLYADLVLMERGVCAEQLEVWVILADADQLRTLHESEGVEERWYRVALISPLTLANVVGVFSGLAYVTDLPCPVLPSNGTPLGFSSIHADGRQIEAVTPARMIGRFVDEHHLSGKLAAITGLDDSPDLGAELIKYLNGQWWYQRHTGDRAIPGYYEVIELLTAALETATRHFHVVDRLDRRGQILEGARRFSPGITLTS